MEAFVITNIKDPESIQLNGLFMIRGDEIAIIKQCASEGERIPECEIVFKSGRSMTIRFNSEEQMKEKLKLYMTVAFEITYEP